MPLYEVIDKLYTYVHTYMHTYIHSYTGEVWGWWMFSLSCLFYVPTMFLPLFLDHIDIGLADDGKYINILGIYDVLL